MDNLYTYVPKDNTLDTEGLYGPWGDSEENLIKRYGARANATTKQEVLDWLEKIDPGRSHSISVLTEPIPPTADQRFLDFANKNQLVQLPSVQILLAAGLIEPEFYKSNGGKKLYKRKRVSYKPINWNPQEKGLLFKHIPHYMLIAHDNIPPEYITKVASTLYHASPKALKLLNGMTTRHGATGSVFVSPSKYHASLFALDRQGLINELEKRLGKQHIKVKNLSYGQWKDAPSDKALEKADVYIDTDEKFEPFSGEQKGYIYSIKDAPYLAKIKKWKHDNGDRELLVEGDIKPDKKEEINIKYDVHPGAAPWIKAASARPGIGLIKKLSKNRLKHKLLQVRDGIKPEEYKAVPAKWLDKFTKAEDKGYEKWCSNEYPFDYNIRNFIKPVKLKNKLFFFKRFSNSSNSTSSYWTSLDKNYEARLSDHWRSQRGPGVLDTKFYKPIGGFKMNLYVPQAKYKGQKFSKNKRVLGVTYTGYGDYLKSISD